LRRGRDEWTTLLDTLGHLYVAGVEIDWAAVTGAEPIERVDLPTYPFQRQRCWVETTRRSSATPSRTMSAAHPLLGTRLRSALRATQYESELDAGEIGYLNDHRVFGQAIMPAAAFVEAGLAAADPTKPHSLDGFVIHAPMSFADTHRRIMQTIVSPNSDGTSVQMFSRDTESDDWTLHAEARLNAASTVPAPAPPVNLDAIRARCPDEIATEAHYDALCERGIDLGPALQGIRQLWRGDAEALGEIVLSAAEADEIKDYRIHPALLDAAFQTLAAAVPAEGGTFLPIALERARLLADPGANAWCHARVRPQATAVAGGSRETLMADLAICDTDGQLFVELSGLALKRADQIAGEPLDRLLYEVVWRPTPRSTARPAPECLVTSAAALLVEDPTRRDDLERYQALNAELDALSSGYVAYALDQLGWQPQPGERVDANGLACRLGVAERHHRLFGRLLEMLAEDGYLHPVEIGYTVKCLWPHTMLTELEASHAALLSASPAFSAELTLLGRCGAHLADALRGNVDPLQLLFPAGDTSVAEHLYTDSPVARTFNEMVRSAVSEVVSNDANRPVRILEIGGGTGGTTAHLLPVLPAERAEYVFTDISPAFTARAAEKFGAYPFVSCRPLDIERDPLDQQFELGRHDIVLAVNVLHAVRDVREALSHIRRLLVPGGLLLLVEVTAPQRWVDLSFGLTDGWWRFTDADLRPEYPLLNRECWLELLTKEGFEAADVRTGDPPHVEQALLIARAPVESGADLTGDWLIFADTGGVGKDLSELIAGRGGHPIVVPHGTMYAPGRDEIQVDPLAPADFVRLMREAVPDAARLAGVVYLWGLDAQPAAILADLEFAESLVVGGALHAVQAVVAAGGSPRLWLVTRGAQPAGDVDVVAPEQAPIWGMGKVIALEHPELRPTRVDLDSADDRPAVSLLRAILDADDEAEVALRADERLAARLVRLSPPANDRASDDQAAELTITDRGTLDGLALQPIRRRRPGHGEVEICVHATGLNFKDVLNVLGMYPGDPGPLGGECAGTIVSVGPGVPDLRPGDDVVALAAGSFRSYVTTTAEFVAPRPAGLSVASAATTAIAYITASVALTHHGQMRAGERVLIHAAAGGVGLAAVQLALATGAEVFATAGSPEKRAFLSDIGVHHVFDSRSFDFTEGVLTATDGEGVDLVLNSLAGEFVPRSLSLLRQGGRFLELGKRDLVSPEAIAGLGRGIVYHLIDWSETAREDPVLITAILHDVLAQVADGRLPTLPVRTFPLDDCRDAFHYMARARHIGKVAVTYPVPGEESAIRPSGYYLITGGLRGLGLEVARHLVARGARHLVLMGRGAPTEAALAAITEMESAGARVLPHQGDVARQPDVAAALAMIDREGLPLHGVFHCAGVLDDGALTQQTWARFRRVLAPKVNGAWLLHQLTAGRAIEHFVLFSSVASVFGSPGQGNHAAANAYLDALAWQRRVMGLPAVSINWGAWAEIGAAAGPAVAERARQHGLDPIAPERGLQALESLLSRSPAQTAVASVRWSTFLERFAAPPFFRELAARPSARKSAHEGAPEGSSSIREALASATPGRRLDILLDFVQTQAAGVLGLGSAQIGPRTPLNELGLDSLMAVELRNLLGQGLAIPQPLPATLVFDYPSVESLAGYLAESVLGINEAPVAVQPALAAVQPAADGRLVAAMLDSLDALSDAEVNLLLAERASPRG
jgi:NADPH:quinone reductase-like Zn-dependent oxidoreductase/SAM-dependent methyltransferase